MENKFGQKEVYDLYIFDLNENLVTVLNSLKQFNVQYMPKENTYYVIAYDALLDEKLLNYIGKTHKQTDYEKALGNKTCISIGKTKGKQFKLIGKSVIRNAATELDQPITLEFPLVEMISQPSFFTNTIKASEFDVVFEVIPSHEKDGENFYNIHM